jgi:hypothetical protein
MTLVGRDAECAAVDQLLQRVRDGASGSLVVRGEAGIGKSAILDYAAQAATGFLIIQVTGIESEMEVAFAARGLRGRGADAAAGAARVPRRSRAHRGYQRRALARLPRGDEPLG